MNERFVRLDSDQNLDILKRLSNGESVENIASQVYLSPSTVSWRVKKMMEWLECDTSIQLVAEALRIGLIK